MRITPGVRDRSFVNDFHLPIKGKKNLDNIKVKIYDADFHLPIQVKTKY